MSIRRPPKQPFEHKVLSWLTQERALDERALAERAWTTADAVCRMGDKTVILEAKRNTKPATYESFQRQLSVLSKGSDGQDTAYVFFVADQARIEQDAGDLLVRVPPLAGAVEAIKREARAAADTASHASITLDLDERASAVVVQSLTEAVARVTRVARACEKAGQLADADHHFEEAQNLRAHLEAVRDARADRGWSPDGDEAPEGTGDLD